MKGIVIYQSKYGATARYAKWISTELDLPLFETGELNTGDLNKYDLVILGSSVYIGKLLIKKWLRANLADICNKKIFLFVVCGTPLNQKTKLDSYITSSVPAEVKNKCRIFFLPGKLKIKELSWLDLVKLKMGALLAKSKTVKKAMLTDYNDVKKENLAELIQAVQNLPFIKSQSFIQELSSN